MTDIVVPNQDDRERAVNFMRGRENTRAVLAGRADGLPLVQAFCRHRLAALDEAAGVAGRLIRESEMPLTRGGMNDLAETVEAWVLNLKGQP